MPRNSTMAYPHPFDTRWPWCPGEANFFFNKQNISSYYSMGADQANVSAQQKSIVIPPPRPIRALAQPPSKSRLFYFKPLAGEEGETPEHEGEIEKAVSLRMIEEIKVRWMSFLKMKEGSFLHDYEVRRELGRGGFGCVYKVKGKFTGIIRAAKKIKKSDLDPKEHERLFNEVRILQSLDHPNIAKLYEVYDHQDHYVLIMELCEGGELFKRIAKNQISRAEAARVTKQLLEALTYIHSKNIVHRDIKPENMLFEKQSGSVKLIDFGIALQKKPNQILNARIGTAYYIAPQVLLKKYDEKCDVWAAGVVLYMMLMKKPPFNGSSEGEIMQNIITEQPVFKGREWSQLPSDCKNLLTNFLKKKAKERPSAFEALQNKWVQQQGVSSIPGESLDTTLSRMQEFGFKNRLEAVVYTYAVAQLLTNSEKMGLQEIFKKADSNCDGTISSEQFKVIMKERIFDQDRLMVLMRLIDLDGSGRIEYTQFLIAALNPRAYLRQQHYERVFQYFDIDHSGDISYEQVAKFLEGKESQQAIKTIFAEIDTNKDGTISKPEFLNLFLKEKFSKFEGGKLSQKKGILARTVSRSRGTMSRSASP